MSGFVIRSKLTSCSWRRCWHWLRPAAATTTTRTPRASRRRRPRHRPRPRPNSDQDDPRNPPVKAKKVTPSAGEANIDTKPKVPKGSGSPPDQARGGGPDRRKGRRPRPGTCVSVRYAGVLFDNGKEFDSSWASRTDPGQGFKFALGAGQVIPGWDRGVVGMRAGGRRKLIIPPDLAYGAQGYPPDIPPNASLIFDIDL